MRNIDKLKAHLKDMAEKIHNTRFQHKEAQRNGGSAELPAWRLHARLTQLQYEYRHHHIAYCELRGRSRKQIEAKVREHNEPNESYIVSIKEQYAWSPEEIAAYEERKAKKDEALHS